MIFVREVELPIRVRGYTSPDVDGNYNVYINRDLDDSVKRRTLKHELSHIEGGHCFCEDISTYEVERSVDD